MFIKHQWKALCYVIYVTFTRLMKLPPPEVPADGRDEPDKSSPCPYNFHLMVTHVTSTHVSLAKASHMAHQLPQVYVEKWKARHFWVSPTDEYYNYH